MLLNYLLGNIDAHPANHLPAHHPREGRSPARSRPDGAGRGACGGAAGRGRRRGAGRNDGRAHAERRKRERHRAHRHHADLEHAHVHHAGPRSCRWRAWPGERTGRQRTRRLRTSPSGAAEGAETTPTTTAPQWPTSARSPEHGYRPRAPGRRTADGRREVSGPAPSAAAKQAPAPPPGSLTPPLPGALGEAIGGVPDFFIESFRVPPFLLPIYQAAGTAYDIPWQVLAAINEVETDYGRDLTVSSAGAEGWMQFLPSSWARYGVDATGAGYEDPYNPADAIFAAARYLAGRRRRSSTSAPRCSPTTTRRRTSKR